MVSGSIQGRRIVDAEGLAGFEGLEGGWVFCGSLACLLVTKYTTLDITSFTYDGVNRAGWRNVRGHVGWGWEQKGGSSSGRVRSDSIRRGE